MRRDESPQVLAEILFPLTQPQKAHTKIASKRA